MEGFARTDDPHGMSMPQVRETLTAWLLAPTLYCLGSFALLPFGYNTFHFALETGSVVIGAIALLVANISRRFTNTSMLLVACTGLGWCAVLDLFHIMSFEGMGLLPGSGANLSSQLWIMARTLQALVLLGAVLFMERAPRLRWVHLACAAFTVTCLALLGLGMFPDTFVAGEGLTRFKIISEFLIIAILVAVGIQVERKRTRFTSRKYIGVQLALIAMVLSELCFSLYDNASDRFNEVGHLLKVFSCWFLFRALVEQTLLQPFIDRNHLLFTLGERLKEMKCLNELARVSQLHESSPATLLASVVGILPAAMLHDKMARVSIVSEHGNFGVAADELPEGRSVVVPLEFDGMTVGTLKLGYPLQAGELRPLFLDEEQALMELVGQRINAVLARQHSRKTIQQMNRLYRMLSGVNRAVVHSISQSQLQWEVFAILRDSCGFSVVVIAERTGTGTASTFRITHRHGLPTGLVEDPGAALWRLASEHWPGGIVHRPAAAVLKVGAVKQSPLSGLLKQADCHELALVPIVVNDSLLGLVLAGAPAGEQFHADVERLLIELGEDVSFAMSQLRQGQRLLEVEERVEDTERRYQVLFDQSPVPMTLMDAGAQRVLARNRAYEQWLGAPLCEITDVQEWFSRIIVEPEHMALLRGQLAENIGKSFAPFGYFQFPETRIFDSDGKVLVATARLTVVQDRILVAFNDITELKENEARLRESEGRFRNMIEDSLFGVMVLEAGRFAYVNPAFAALTGWKSRELINARLEDFALLLPGTKAGMAPPETSLDPELQRVFEFRRKDGTIINLYATASQMPWGEGRAEVMIVQDITEKLRYERQLRDSSALLENLAQQVPGVIYQYRLYPDGRACIPYATRSLWDIFELKPAELVDDAAKVYERIHPEDIASVRENIGKSAQNLSVWLQDFRVLLPRQGLRWRSGFARPQRLPDGSVLWHGFIEDSTARRQRDEELRQSNDKLQRSVSATLDIISRIMDHRDPYTAGHQHRVGSIARLIAAELGLDQETQELLELTGIVHDVGKIAVPTEILTKPMALSEIEYEIVKEHAAAGYAILQGTNLPQRIVDAVHQHHERMDGSGYPQGLKGEAICLEARIIAVADVLESMTSHRPYRPAMELAQAALELEQARGLQFDASVVDAVMKIVREGRLPGTSGRG